MPSRGEIGSGVSSIQQYVMGGGACRLAPTWHPIRVYLSAFLAKETIDGIAERSRSHVDRFEFSDLEQPAGDKRGIWTDFSGGTIKPALRARMIISSVVAAAFGLGEESQ